MIYNGRVFTNFLTSVLTNESDLHDLILEGAIFQTFLPSLMNELLAFSILVSMTELKVNFGFIQILIDKKHQ